MNAGGPPPGGYGFGPPPGSGPNDPTTPSGSSSTDSPSNASGQGSPFAAPPQLRPQSYQQSYAAPPSSGGSVKKIGLPILGISVLCIRVLLLCGRASSSSFDSHAYPTYNPPVPAVSLDLSGLQGLGVTGQRAGHPSESVSAVAQDTGDIYFAVGEELHRRDASSKDSSATLAFEPRLLAAAGRRVCWTTLSDSVSCRASNFEDSPEVVTTGVGSVTALRVDDKAVYVVDGGQDDGEPVHRLVRVELSTKKVKTLATGEQFTNLTVDGGFLYWLDSAHDESTKPAAILRLPVTGGTPKVVAAFATAPEWFAAKGGDVFVSRFASSNGSQRSYDISRVAGTGGALTAINLEGISVMPGAHRFDLSAKSIILVGADGDLYKAPRVGGKPVKIASSESSLEHVEVAKNAVVFWDSGQLAPDFASLQE